MSDTYTTKQDAIEQAILPALGEYADDHNIDAIFDATFAYEGAGFVQTATVDEFWVAVEANAR